MSTTTLVTSLKKQAAEKESHDALLQFRTPLIVLSQIVLVCMSYYFSFVLRLDNSFDASAHSLFWHTIPWVIVIKLVVFYHFGLLRGWWRYVGMSDLLDIASASFVAAVLMFGIFVFLMALRGYPRSVVPIDMLLSMILVGGARFTVRAYTERAKTDESQEKVLIIGAGRAGSAIARELKLNPELGYYPLGFVDDDPSKRGIKINAVKVLGNTDALSHLIKKHGAKCVLIAIPSATGHQVERIIDKCRESKVDFKILPSIGERLNGAASVKQFRKLRVEDLLSRHPVQLDLGKIREEVQDKVLLITGAGGSIGSELARQISTFEPRRLVLFERSENDLFRIGMELSSRFPKLDFVPVVGDILDVTALREVFSLHQPSSVFHAAAYKHVPMMEKNCFQAVSNNIFGTYNVALVAKQFHADNFVLISSDKAVNPTNIMGATKRAAELITLSLQLNKTRFIAVRFGNVLGSNGSVSPIFENQIANGGPVTVSHPEAKRYFMTISEAVGLVLQASTMGKGGEIFVLNMGEPIKIIDLARRMISLSGLEPDKDIQISFTGLRPGEKLFEEVRLEGEGIKPTTHEQIWVFGGGQPSFAQVRSWLDELSTLVEARNVHGLISKLVSIVPEYRPSEQLKALCELDRHDQFVVYKRARASLEAHTA
ncbi:MAG TPA: nucleoside-diphosphate sugar epimerase/dehydratase [Terriglobales bacterium]|nr:nucleoside-diphosphate sugar epimerase/dehydratase [Terriglobales bacterium]